MHAFADLFLILDKVDSTNNYAMGLIHSGTAVDGLGCFAIEQTEGKGRRGKLWETQKGKNIVLSVIVEATFLPIYRQFYLSAATALSCLEFFNKYIPGKTKIKWPNDIFINDRKAGGILIENIIQGTLWQWAVIGIGININQTSFLNEDERRVSLKTLSGADYNIIELAKELHNCILRGVNSLKNEGAKILMEQYSNHLYKLNESVRLKKQNLIFDAVITGVSHGGELITYDVMERRYKLDEIEMVL